ncbi:FkbM family methyltransferase [Thermodesulfobacteriota bacterium]
MKVPKNEAYRVDNIIHGREYAINDNRHRSRKLTVFDVGANLGLYSLYIKMLYPDSLIFCFEPVPRTFELLHENLAGLQGITLNRFGLFNETKKEIIHIRPDNTGHSSIKLPLGGKVEQAKVKLKDSGMYFDSTGLEHLDILKIDTEGCEVEILESLGRRLERVDYVLVESHTKHDRREINRILRGFRTISDQSGEDGRGIIKYMNNRL